MTRPLPFYQIDAFAERPFMGNPACVVALEEGFLPDATLQAIAAENNVSETAFIMPAGEGVWALRWFTPTKEVALCGHATLAAGHVLFEHCGFTGDRIAFETRQAGRLSVRRAGTGLEMDFPASPVREVAITAEVSAALGARPLEVWAGTYLAAMFAMPEDVTGLDPDLAALARIGAETDYGAGNVGVLAPGGAGDADVTTRFFAPGSGIAEDPATGSWMCVLAPVFHAKLGLERLVCHQAFPGRGARLVTRMAGDRVQLTGEAVTVIEGRITV
jgi:PhzF family phenazine biosynthesis protein